MFKKALGRPYRKESEGALSSSQCGGQGFDPPLLHQINSHHSNENSRCEYSRRVPDYQPIAVDMRT